MCADSIGSGVGAVVEMGAFGQFPFQNDFRAVVEGELSWAYLIEVQQAMEPVIDTLKEQVESGEANAELVRVLMVAVSAHGRVAVAKAYRTMIAERSCSVGEFAADMYGCWRRYVTSQMIVDVVANDLTVGWLGPVVSTVWRSFSVRVLPTADLLLQTFRPVVEHLRVKVLSTVLVETNDGRLLTSLPAETLLKPVVPVDVYTHLLRVKVADTFEWTPERIMGLEIKLACSPYVDARMIDWAWIVASATSYTDGYCYQYLLEPSLRFAAVRLLGKFPTVAEVLTLADLGGSVEWCSLVAQVRIGQELHVVTPGYMDLELLRFHSERVVGSVRRVVPTEDLYAKQLVDQFFQKYKVQQEVLVPTPCDAALGALSLDTDAGVSRSFSDVASVLYEAVGASLSPRAREAAAAGTGALRGDPLGEDIDHEMIRVLYDRLADGPVIDESYYVRVRKRTAVLRRAPRLDSSGGRAVHVFAGFPADSGGSTDCWFPDKDWNVPGWKSYVAHFSDERRIVTFVGGDGVGDVRIDCSGDGVIQLDACRLPVAGTVLWFTQSIKLQVSTSRAVVLRVSVPDAGSAVAVGVDIRRYLHLPGYAVAVRSFDMPHRNADVVVKVGPRRAMSGCDVRSGKSYVDRGRHKFRFTGLASAAPVKFVVRTEPPEALAAVISGRIRVSTGSRDYVTVICDLTSTSCYVEVDQACSLSFSVLQIVDVRQFESVALSVLNSRS